MEVVDVPLEAVAEEGAPAAVAEEGAPAVAAVGAGRNRQPA